jgi:hypothetical protein
MLWITTVDIQLSFRGENIQPTLTELIGPISAVLNCLQKFGLLVRRTLQG